MRALDKKIIAEAESWLGTPYHHQAGEKHIGADCLGLVRGIYAAIYGTPAQTPPPYARHVLDEAQPMDESLHRAAKKYLCEVEKAAPRPANVLLFRMQPDLPARHMGILVTPFYMIHAAENHSVLKTPFGRWWQRKLVGVFRFPDFEEINLHD